MMGEEESSTPGLRPARPRPNAKPILWTVPYFAFPDQDGKTIDQPSLRGRISVMNFIETNCNGLCPKMTDQLAVLQRELTDPRVQFISVSIDPATDDAKTRREYGIKHQVDLARWHFVAPPDRAAALLLGHAMKVAGPPQERDFQMLHVDRFVLVDSQGRVQGSYIQAD